MHRVVVYSRLHTGGYFKALVAAAQLKKKCKEEWNEKCRGENDGRRYKQSLWISR